jgi:hypothetical protein
VGQGSDRSSDRGKVVSCLGTGTDQSRCSRTTIDNRSGQITQKVG